MGECGLPIRLLIPAAASGGLMKTILCILGLLFLGALPAAAQVDSYGLPPGAQVIEVQPIQSQKYPQRALILWMLNPQKVPRDNPDDPYTCPEYTRGSFYQGPTRVSLVDQKTKKITNTIKIITEYLGGEDSFDIPYRIQKGFYYHVEGAAKGKEGKPTIMWLKDYNGDGHAWEFALFDAIACMGLPTTLIGYSESQDRVMQYPVELTTVSGKKSTTSLVHWVDYLFSKSPKRPGFWQYAIDYRGRAGSLDEYEVRYRPGEEKFVARMVSKGDGS